MRWPDAVDLGCATAELCKLPSARIQMTSTNPRVGYPIEEGGGTSHSGSGSRRPVCPGVVVALVTSSCRLSLPSCACIM